MRVWCCCSAQDGTIITVAAPSLMRPLLPWPVAHSRSVECRARGVHSVLRQSVVHTHWQWRGRRPFPLFAPLRDDDYDYLTI